jgi:hypothetical protein
LAFMGSGRQALSGRAYGSMGFVAHTTWLFDFSFPLFLSPCLVIVRIPPHHQAVHVVASASFAFQYTPFLCIIVIRCAIQIGAGVIRSFIELLALCCHSIKSKLYTYIPSCPIVNAMWWEIVGALAGCG